MLFRPVLTIAFVEEAGGIKRGGGAGGIDALADLLLPRLREDQEFLAAVAVQYFAPETRPVDGLAAC